MKAQLSICLDGASEVYIVLILITRHNINYILKSQGHKEAETFVGTEEYHKI